MSAGPGSLGGRSVQRDDFDLVVVGGGLVGLATAYQHLRALPGSRVAVLEKEDVVARHQSGHNSGVIHSGINYVPGSLKARLCREGAAELSDFAEAHGVEVLYLHTHPFLPGALEFWQGKGFAVLQREADPVWQTIHMQCLLPPVLHAPVPT